MGVLFFLVFGLVVGLIARGLIPGRQQMGWLATMALGVAGSIMGGVVGSILFGHDPGEPVAAGWIGSVVGAILLLAIASRFSGKRLKHV